MNNSYVNIHAPIQVYCIYTEEGCEWKGTLSSIKAHLDSQSGCCYVLLSCPNSCGLDLIRKDIQVHLIDECELRTCECKHCGYKDNYNCMSGHYSTCVEYPVPCPEGCSQRMKRKSLERHKIKCPMGQVKCPFSHAGCNKPLNRKDLKNHLKNEVHSHLLLFLGPLEQVRLSVNETRATANTLSVSVNTINTNLSELRAEQLQAKGAAQRYRERLTRVTTDVQNLYTEQFQAKGESQRHRHKLTEVSTQVSTNTKKLEEIDLDLSELHAEQFQAKVKSQRHRHKLTEVSTQVSTNTKKLEEIDHDLSKLRSEQLQAKGESQRLREELTRVSTNTKNLEELLVPPCIIFWLYLVYQFIAYMYYKLYA